MPKSNPLSSVTCQYLVPSKRLLVYDFPETLAIMALHFVGVKAHSNIHHPNKKVDIVIMDQHGLLFGEISYLPGDSPDTVLVVIKDQSQTGFFRQTIEKYLTEVLGVVLPPK